MPEMGYALFEGVAALGGAVGVTGSDAPLYAGLAVAYAVAIFGLAAMARAKSGRRA